MDPHHSPVNPVLRSRSHVRPRRTPGLLPGARSEVARFLGRARDLRQIHGPARGKDALRLLRGPAHRQRDAPPRPRPDARDEGRLPPLPGHVRLLRPAPRAAGTPTACRSRSRSKRSSASTAAAPSRSTASRRSRKKCIDSVFRYIDEWRHMTRRIAFWVDLDDAYVTFHKELRRERLVGAQALFDEGLLYQDYKVVWWWPQGGTALSAGEVGQGYKEVDDPSVVVRFPREGRGEHVVPRVDHHALDPADQHRARRRSRTSTYATVKLEERREASSSPRRWSAKLLGEARARGRRRPARARRSSAPSTSRPSATRAPEGGAAYRVISADFVSIDSGTRHGPHRARLRRGRLQGRQGRRASGSCSW